LAVEDFLESRLHDVGNIDRELKVTIKGEPEDVLFLNRATNFGGQVNR
jgi:hypothetical protein